MQINRSAQMLCRGWGANESMSLIPCETTGYYALFLKFVLPTNHLHRCMKTNNAGCLEVKLTVKSTIINLKGTIKELLSWSESLILETWRCNVEYEKGDMIVFSLPALVGLHTFHCSMLKVLQLCLGQSMFCLLLQLFQ